MSVNLIDELERESAHADNMASMAAYWMGRARRAEREKLEILTAAVRAVGGEIRVPNEILLSLPQVELLQYQDFSKNEFVLRTRDLATSTPAR